MLNGESTCKPKGDPRVAGERGPLGVTAFRANDGDLLLPEIVLQLQVWLLSQILYASEMTMEKPDYWWIVFAQPSVAQASHQISFNILELCLILSKRDPAGGSPSTCATSDISKFELVGASGGRRLSMVSGS